MIANTRGSSFLEPDTVILHPTNWLGTRLLTDTASQFYGGGPFTGAYGNAGATGLFGESIWGKRVVLSTVVGAGTALVGSFGQAAQVFRRGGVTVEATKQPRHLLHLEPGRDQSGGATGTRRLPAERLHGDLRALVVGTGQGAGGGDDSTSPPRHYSQSWPG